MRSTSRDSTPARATAASAASARFARRFPPSIVRTVTVRPAVAARAQLGQPACIERRRLRRGRRAAGGRGAGVGAQARSEFIAAPRRRLFCADSSPTGREPEMGRGLSSGSSAAASH